MSIGQTLDIEITPDVPRELRLRVFKGQQPESPVLGEQLLHVRDAR